MRPPRENRERAPRKERAPREPREDGAPAPAREGRERRERPPRERRERAPRVEQDGESSGLQVSFYDNPLFKDGVWCTEGEKGHLISSLYGVQSVLRNREVSWIYVPRQSLEECEL